MDKNFVIEVATDDSSLNVTQERVELVWDQLAKLGSIEKVLEYPSRVGEVGARAQGLATMIGTPLWDNQTTNTIERLIIGAKMWTDSQD
jgi:hypothetical protein